MCTPNAAVAASPYVHTLETESHPPSKKPNAIEEEANRLEMDFRHSGTWKLRLRIRTALENLPDRGSRLERWDDCGRFATVERSKDRFQVYRITCSRCHDRFCPTCGKERSRVIAANVTAKINGQRHRLITLTLRHGKEPLKELLNKLYQSFKKLRRSRVWNTSIRGGIAFTEVKYVNGWHPHIHLITVGNFIPHAELVEAWEKATGDSKVVDIRPVKDATKTAAYVAKYASKPLDRSVTYHSGHCTEAMGALKGVKLLMTFGTWRGLKTTDEITDEVWETVGSLKALLERFTMGEPEAIEIITRIRSQIQWQREQEERQEAG